MNGRLTSSPKSEVIKLMLTTYASPSSLGSVTTTSMTGGAAISLAARQKVNQKSTKNQYNNCCPFAVASI